MKTLGNATFGITLLSGFLLISCSRPSNEIPITTSSEEAKQLFLEGRTKLHNVQTEDAAGLFDKAIEKDPNFALAYAYRANAAGGAAVQNEDISKAVSLMDKVTDGERLLILLTQAQNKPDRTAEKSLIDTLLTRFPLDPEVQYLAGALYFFDFFDHEKAVEHLSRTVSLDSTRAEAYNVMGYCEWDRGKYGAAETAFKNYIRVVPNNPNAYDSYADLLKKLGKYDESIEQYEKALNADPQFVSSFIGIGDNYVLKGDFVKARENYKQLFDRGRTVSNKLSALFWTAASFVHQKDFASALKTLADRRDLAEKEGRAYTALWSHAWDGFILGESGKSKEALEKYTKAMAMIDAAKLPDQDRENLRVMAKMWQAYALALNGKFAEAQAAAEAFKQDAERRQVVGEQRNANDVLGFIQFRQGNYDNALGLFKSGSEDDPWTMYYQAMSLLKKGDKVGGTEMLEKIVNWNANSMSLALTRPRAMEMLAKPRAST